MEKADPGTGNASNVLRNPIFVRLFSGSVLSSIGASAGGIAIIWLVFSSTGSAIDVAYTGIALVIPRIIFGLLSGSLADRYSKTKLMIIADFSRALMLIVLVASLILFGLNLLVLLGAVFVLGVGQSIFRISLNSFIPSVVSPDQLGTANGFLTSTQEVFSIVGAPVGGVLIAIGGVTTVLLLNAVTYFASGIFIVLAAILVKNTSEPEAQAEEKRSLAKDIAEGFSYIRGESGLFKLTIVSFAANFFLALFFSFIVVYIGNVLDEGSFAFGIMAAASGAGFGIGALIVGRRRFEKRFGSWFCIGWGLAGISILGLVLIPGVVSAALFIFAIGLGGGFGNTVFFTGVQKYVPRKMLARYLSIDEVGSLAANPAGQASGGFMISAFGISTVYIVASLGTFIPMLVLFLLPDVRALSAE